MGVRSGRGDNGLTDLYSRKRVSKACIEIAAIGDLDELSSYLGLIRSKVRSREDRVVIESIQQAIAKMASEISVETSKKKKVGIFLNKADADWIKSVLIEYEKKVDLDSCFCLPGDSELSAFIDVARAVARRVERSVVHVYKKGKLENMHILSYLNCVSDVLFIMARKKARTERRVKAKKGKN